MCGELQKTGLTEIIPLICTFSRASILFFPILSPLRAHRWAGCSGCNMLCSLFFKGYISLEKCIVTPHLEQNKAQILARCIGKALHRRPHLVFCCFLSPRSSPLATPAIHQASRTFFFVFVGFAFLATPCNIWDLCFPTSYGTRVPGSRSARS